MVGARFDKTFAGDFDFTRRELPGGAPKRMFWYPGASRVGGRDGMLLEFRPAGMEPWIGMFADGAIFPGGGDCVVALPDRMSVAVVCGGVGYRVAVRSPEDWEEISRDVVTQQPTVVAALDLVLFAGFTSITAWGRHGRAWGTGQLVSDDLELLNVAGSVLTAGGSSPPGTTIRFTVDLTTGKPDHTSRSRRS